MPTQNFVSKYFFKPKILEKITKHQFNHVILIINTEILYFKLNDNSDIGQNSFSLVEKFLVA